MNFANYAEYLWYLLPRPFKLLAVGISGIYKLMTATGPLLDDAKEKVFLIRRMAMIATAEEKALDRHGADRQMPRYAGEEDDPYRERLLAKYELARLGGTRAGVKRALASLGYPDARIELMKIYDPDRWAEFLIWLDRDKLLELDNMATIEREVNRVKQASAKANYAFAYRDELQITSGFTKGFSQHRLICNTFKCGEDAKL